jgi:hypothetical protein
MISDNTPDFVSKQKLPQFLYRIWLCSQETPQATVFGCFFGKLSLHPWLMVWLGKGWEIGCSLVLATNLDSSPFHLQMELQ